MPSSANRVTLYRATTTHEVDAWLECREWLRQHSYTHGDMLIVFDDEGRYVVTGFRDSKKGATDGKQD